jgi:glycosyltransferase involved in cell wall biosynthesis
MRLAVLWSRFGPYHVARLRGVAASIRSGDVIGIEIAHTDRTYSWAIVSECQGVKQRTLFPACAYEALAPRRIAARVRNILDAFNPNAVAVNGWALPEARAAIGWCRRKGVRCILMSESKEDDSPRMWWKEIVKRHLVRRCDSALVGGTRQADYLRTLGFKGEIFVGYDVVDCDYFREGAEAARRDEAQNRGRLGLPQRYFFACTRFIARKNIDGLLKAYAAYRTAFTGQPWGLVIAGSGQEAESLRKLEQRLGIDGVFWPGFVQYGELPLYYGLASAFVHPALSEPWGLVVNEAIASGLPVLVSRTVGARYELLAEGENGYAFDPTDSDDLANKMLTLTRMGDDQQVSMSRAAYRIAAQWTPMRFAQGLLEAAGSAAAA